MDRRIFLKTASATVILTGLGSRRSLIRGESPACQAEDIRLRVLQCAIHAPNSHNAQPWLIELTPDNAMRLYIDRSRLLPATDPAARQIHISQGTFLELVDIAARQFGHRAEIRYFPEGEYSSTQIEDRPVSAITLHPQPGLTPDPLFAEIARRRTNKRPYDRTRALTTAELVEMQSASKDNEISWRITTDAAQRREIARMCKEAMAIEVSSPERNRETAHWFRFSDRELQEKRDGFGIAQSGTEGVKKWIAERFVLSRERAANPRGAFAQGAVTAIEAQAGSASVFAALVSKTNTRMDQIRTGRAYARVHLAASRLGVAMQPLSQLLEEYAEMAALQQRMKQTLQVEDTDTVQMLFRLGYARPAPPAPRRDVRALVRQHGASENAMMSRFEG
jgi:nitroreductase